MPTIDRGGHGAHPGGANTCADNEVTEYPLGGGRPAHDLRHPVEQRPPV